MKGREIKEVPLLCESQTYYCIMYSFIALRHLKCMTRNSCSICWANYIQIRRYLNAFTGNICQLWSSNWEYNGVVEELGGTCLIQKKNKKNKCLSFLLFSYFQCMEMTMCADNFLYFSVQFFFYFSQPNVSLFVSLLTLQATDWHWLSLISSRLTCKLMQSLLYTLTAQEGSNVW